MLAGHECTFDICAFLSCGANEACNKMESKCDCRPNFIRIDGKCSPTCGAITCPQNQACNPRTTQCECKQGYREKNGTCREGVDIHGSRFFNIKKGPWWQNVREIVFYNFILSFSRRFYFCQKNEIGSWNLNFSKPIRPYVAFSETENCQHKVSC